MSNEIKKVEKTAIETETEKRVNISGREWDEYQELKESNKNLIAERETLTAEVEKYKKLYEDEVESRLRLSKYWEAEQNKVKMMVQLVEAVKPDEYIRGSEVFKRIADM